MGGRKNGKIVREGKWKNMWRDYGKSIATEKGMCRKRIVSIAEENDMVMHA